MSFKSPMEMQRTVEELSESEIALREQFIIEYQKDNDVFYAAIRCDFTAPFAVEWGPKLFKDVYVQKRLAEERFKKLQISEEEDRADYEANLRWLMRNGPESSRVSATKQYGELKGWTKPDGLGDAAEQMAEVLKEFATKAPV